MKMKILLLPALSLSLCQLVAAQVGIGTAAPHASSRLDISSTNSGLLIPRMTSLQRTSINAPAKGLLVFDDETTSFWFYTGTAWTELGSTLVNSSKWTLNGTHIYNANNGNVGVGTTTPADKLTVQTPGASYGLSHTDGITTVSTWLGTASFFPGGWIGTKSNHPLNFFTAGGTAKMTIFPTGNIVVGDNATPPVGKFTVRTTNNADGISHVGDGGNILKTRMGGTSAGIGTFSPTNMRIFSGGLSRLFIAQATGNVGIGTDNPTYKLAVVGGIRAYEVVVENTWADYVFSKNYQLLPLPDLEKFILQNCHLPNIPSAAEIEQNGLHLGDVQKRMMEKIEELTLYIIGLKKELTDLQQQVAAKSLPCARQ